MVTAHGTVALNRAAHSDDTVIFDGGAAGNRQIISTAGIPATGLGRITGTRSIVRVGEVCAAALHGGFSCGIGKHQGHTVGNGEFGLAAVTIHGAAAGKGDGTAAASRREGLVKIGILRAIDFINGRAGLHKFAGEGARHGSGVGQGAALFAQVSHGAVAGGKDPAEHRIAAGGRCRQGIGGRFCSSAKADSISVRILNRVGTMLNGSLESNLRGQLLIFDGRGLEGSGIVAVRRSLAMGTGFYGDGKGAARVQGDHAICTINRTVVPGSDSSGTAGAGTLGAADGIGDLDPTGITVVGKGDRVCFAGIRCTATGSC